MGCEIFGEYFRSPNKDRGDAYPAESGLLFRSSLLCDTSPLLLNLVRDLPLEVRGDVCVSLGEEGSVGRACEEEG
jgi:hypothetical protein